MDKMRFTCAALDAIDKACAGQDTIIAAAMARKVVPQLTKEIRRLMKEHTDWDEVRELLNTANVGQQVTD
jgi:hypothetical protein